MLLLIFKVYDFIFKIYCNIVFIKCTYVLNQFSFFTDLSFNFITCIRNVENLVNLIYLNLTSNEIAILENMDSLLKLESFLVRQNKIKSFNSVCS